MRCENFGCKRNWSWLGFGLAKFGGLAFFCFGSKIGEKVKLWFLCNLGGELSQMHQTWGVKKFGCERNWSWLGFGLAKFGVLAFFSLVVKLVNKWSYGFCAILVGNCHKCIKNEVWKVWLQKKKKTFSIIHLLTEKLYHL